MSPIYFRIAYETALSYSNLKQYDSSIQILEKIIQENKKENLESAIVLLANSYDNKEDSISAEKYYKISLDKYPNSYNANYEYGVFLTNRKRYTEAYSQAKKAIKINQEYFPAHRLISSINAKCGMITPSLMASSIAILHSPGSQRSLNLLQQIDNFCSQKISTTEEIDFLMNDKGIEGVETLVKSHVALQKDYKMKDQKFDYAVVKQLHLIFSDIENTESEDPFLQENYIKVFRHIKSKGYFNDFIMVLLASVNSKDIQKGVKNESKSITDFLKEMKSYFKKNQFIKDVEIENKKVKMQCEEVENYIRCEEKLETEDEKASRLTVFFYQNGILKSYGKFEDSKKEGTWNYFNSIGDLSNIYNYKNNKQEGVYQNFHTNGQIEEEGFYKEDSLDGVLKTYSPLGVLVTEIEVSNNKKNGKTSVFHLNGNLKKECSYIDNKLDGAYTTYYIDGKTIQEQNFYEKGDVIDYYISFYKNGDTNTFYTIDQHKIHGNYYEYGINKNLIKLSKYNHGDIESSVEYYNNGLLSEENVYEKGYLKQSKNYDYEGNLSSIVFYNKNTISKILKYENGIEKGEEKIGRNGKLNEKWFYTNESSIEGDIEKDNREGKWKYYYINGNLKNERNFVKNKEDGLIKTYRFEGTLEKEYFKKEDNAEGLFKEYFDNGNLKQIGNYHNDEMIGEWKIYYLDGTLRERNFYDDEGQITQYKEFSPDGKIDKDHYYINGCKTEQLHYDQEGNVYSHQIYKKGDDMDVNMSSMKYQTYIAPLKNGMYHGQNTTVIVDDIKYAENNFENGKRHKRCIFYYPNGSIKSYSHYLMGDYHGIDTMYFPNGMIQEISPYKFDELTGEDTRHFPDGGVWRKANFINGNFDGDVNYFGTNDELVMQKHYKNDYLIYYIKNNDQGEFIDTVYIGKNLTYTITSNYKNGKKAFEQSIVKGFVANKMILYNTDENLVIEYENNEYGNMISKKINYKNGSKCLDETYQENPNGERRLYYNPDGKLILSQELKSSEIHGQVKLYDLEGNETKIIKYNNNVAVQKIK
jgi:antitoxin component YwqK of YwqJK toxin-antitoxin module